MKKLLIGAVCFVFLLASNSFAGKKTYINGIDANFPPFSYVDKNGNPTGFDVQAINWIAKKMGFKVIHKPMDWDGIIPNLLAKKIDMIAAGMSITPEREKVVNFTIPYWEIKQVMVVKKGSNLTVEDILKGKKILGVQRGTSEAKWLEKNKKKHGWNFQLRYYDSAPLAVVDLVNGRIDAAAMDDAPAYDAARKKPVKVIGTFGMPAERFGYAVRKQDKKLLNTLNTGLRLLMKDPYWQKLIKKYHPGR